jgi:hypothetical protein
VRTDRAQQRCAETLSSELLAHLQRRLIDVGDRTRMRLDVNVAVELSLRRRFAQPRGERRRRRRRPAALCGQMLDRRAPENRVDGAELDQAHFGVERRVTRMQLHASKHASPAAQLEHHRTQHVDVLIVRHAKQREVLSENRLGERHHRSIVVGDIGARRRAAAAAVVVELLQDALRHLTRVPAPRRPTEIFERRKEVQKATISEIGRPLCATAIEKRCAEIDQRLARPRARIDVDFRTHSGARRLGSLQLMHVVDRRVEVHRLEALQRVCVNEVVENRLCR